MGFLEIKWHKWALHYKCLNLCMNNMNIFLWVWFLCKYFCAVLKLSKLMCLHIFWPNLSSFFICPSPTSNRKCIGCFLVPLTFSCWDASEWHLSFARLVLSHCLKSPSSSSGAIPAHLESEASCYLSLIVNESTDADKQPNTTEMCYCGERETLNTSPNLSVKRLPPIISG